MNQEKIGVFIKNSRKKKNLTQQELGEKLGVSEKSVSNWENGRNMPDLSLFEPLCKELGISVNELIQGEIINENELKDKTDKNIIETIKYTSDKYKKKNNKKTIFLMIIFLLISIILIIINTSDRNILIYISLILLVISTISYYNLIKNKSFVFKWISIIIFFIISLFSLIYIDFLCVNITKRIPKFCFSEEHFNNIDLYHGLFYNVYKINTNEKINEYTIVDVNKKYNIDTVPISPFNREKSGFDSIIKFKSNKLELNNITNLYNKLPFSELETKIEIKNNKDLYISYNANYVGFNKDIVVKDEFKNINIIIDDEVYSYNIDTHSLEERLLYNTVVSFMLFNSLDSITFNFNDSLFYVNREFLKKDFNEYKYIIRDDRLDYFFNEYVEKRFNNYDYIKLNFKKIFIENNLKKTNRIEIIGGESKKIIENNKEIEEIIPVVKKEIVDKKDITNIIDILSNSSYLPKDSFVTLEGSKYKIKFIDDNNKVIYTFLIFQNGNFGIKEKHYVLDIDSKNKLFQIIE